MRCKKYRICTEYYSIIDDRIVSMYISSPSDFEPPIASPSEKKRDCLSPNSSSSREIGGVGGKVARRFVGRFYRWRLEVEVDTRSLVGEVVKQMGVLNLHRNLSFHRYLFLLKLVVNLARIRVRIYNSRLVREGKEISLVFPRCGGTLISNSLDGNPLPNAVFATDDAGKSDAVST
jgi:hypothetical protein